MDGGKIMSLTTGAVLAVLMMAASPAHAADWTLSPWAARSGVDGACRLDAAGSSKRAEERIVSCVAGGVSTRAIDCDPASRPAAERMVQCRMDWSCAEWASDVFAEGDKLASIPFDASRGARLGATIACTNAKQADPAGVGSCRAALVEGAVEILGDAPRGTSGNPNYAWIGCVRTAR